VVFCCGIIGWCDFVFIVLVSVGDSELGFFLKLFFWFFGFFVEGIVVFFLGGGYIWFFFCLNLICLLFGFYCGVL